MVHSNSWCDSFPEWQEVKRKGFRRDQTVFPDQRYGHRKIDEERGRGGKDENHPKMWVTAVFPVRDIEKQTYFSLSPENFAPKKKARSSPKSN